MTYKKINFNIAYVPLPNLILALVFNLSVVLYHEEMGQVRQKFEIKCVQTITSFVNMKM